MTFSLSRAAGEGGGLLVPRNDHTLRDKARQLRREPTEAEKRLWSILRDRQLADAHFRRQHPIGPFFADFACVEAGWVIEVDGGQHFDADGIESDRRRTSALAEAGFRVMRFTDREVLLEREGVLSAILDRLTASHPHPNPLPPAGEGAEHDSTEKEPMP